jgi:UDP-N-acetylmuramyl pentapeptide phosphotransferase/UDP-N-acetylglucosamine-1-phosphate transferase
MSLIGLKVIFGIFFHFFLNLVFKKMMFFNDNLSYSKHKKLAVDNKSTLLTGGLSFLVLLFIFFEGNYYLKLFCCLIFIIGIISDLNLINSPLKRLFFQAIVISFFIFYFENNIYFTDIYFLDLILEYKIISYIFTIYCFLIIINGTNFIDGLNGLVIGYYILSLSILLTLILNKNISYDYSLLIILLMILVINFPFNLLGKNFLGDSGSYLVAFIVGYVLVDFYRSHPEISALFIVALLWYPAFENLFSIIRKKIDKTDPSKPDTNHFHQLIFKFFMLKLKDKKKTNIICSLIINFYNLLVFFVAYYLFNSSIGLTILLLINAILYTYCYLFLLKRTNHLEIEN